MLIDVVSDNKVRYYINYCRLLVTCLIPLIALTFFNYKIFHGIR